MALDVFQGDTELGRKKVASGRLQVANERKIDGKIYICHLHTCNLQPFMLTSFDDEEYIVKALLAGASGYLLKDIPAEDLAKAVHLAYKGIYQLEPSIAGKLIGSLSNPAVAGAVQNNQSVDAEAVADQTDLTEREVEVLRLIANGSTNREIAEKLVISEGTVKNHVSNILSRLRLRDRTQAAIYAREHNLL